MYMKVLIQIHFTISGSKVLKRGDMKVNSFEYEINPDEAAAESAKRWISELQKEFPGMIIEKVVYNSTDITEKIKPLQ